MATPAVDLQDKLGWMLSDYLDLPEVRSVVLLSQDGLRLTHFNVEPDQAERFAAAAAGVQSLVKALAGFCGGPGNQVRQFLGEYDEGLILITAAGTGALLGVSTTVRADAGLVAHRMNELVQRLGTELASHARRQSPGGSQP